MILLLETQAMFDIGAFSEARIKCFPFIMQTIIVTIQQSCLLICKIELNDPGHRSSFRLEVYFIYFYNLLFPLEGIFLKGW